MKNPENITLTTSNPNQETTTTTQSKNLENKCRTVWEIANNKERREIRFGKHPTQKPLRILKRIIELSSEPGDLVFTPFAGAGSECLAALELNRDYLGFELEQEYIEIANKRLANAHTEPTSQNLSKQADTDSHEGKLF